MSRNKTPGGRGKRPTPTPDAAAGIVLPESLVSAVDSSSFQPETPAEDDTFDIDPTLTGTGNVDVDVDVHEETNRLTAFVQHVLAENDPRGHDERAEAEHLLSFSEEGLFAPTHRAEDLLHDAGVEVGAGDASIQDTLDRENIADVGQLGEEALDPDLIAREAEAAQQQQQAEEGGPRWGKKRRRSRDADDNTPKTKKESHADVERRRRDMINEGITALSALLPGSSARSKGALLRQAVDHLNDLSARVQKFDEEIARREEEKVALQHELAQVRTGLEEEQKRSLKYERFWRAAEDRAASGEFDSQRLRAELEAIKKATKT